MDKPVIQQDWRDGAAYASLHHADRALLCWEWLRRNPEYQRQAEATGAAAWVGARRWRLHRFLPPNLAVPNACPMWRASDYAHVLAAEAKFGKADPQEGKYLARLLSQMQIFTDDDGQHLAICDGLHLIRLDVMGDLLADGATIVSVHLHGIGRLAVPLAMMGRLNRFIHGGAIAQEAGSQQQRARQILTLRAWDGLCSGVSHRDLAIELLDQDASDPSWREAFPSLRLRAQRLAHAAHRLSSGGFWSLLGTDR